MALEAAGMMFPHSSSVIEKDKSIPAPLKSDSVSRTKHGAVAEIEKGETKSEEKESNRQFISDVMQIRKLGFMRRRLK